MPEPPLKLAALRSVAQGSPRTAAGPPCPAGASRPLTALAQWQSKYTPPVCVSPCVQYQCILLLYSLWKKMQVKVVLLSPWVPPGLSLTLEAGVSGRYPPIACSGATGVKTLPSVTVGPGRLTKPETGPPPTLTVAFLRHLYLS